MTGLLAATICLGVLTALNLLLTLGVVRRLREHTARLSELGSDLGPRDLILGPGGRPAEFTATTVGGRQISRDWLGGLALIGFFAPGCGPCEEWLPRFVEAAAANAGRSLAVVVEGAGETGEQVVRLRNVAHVVVEEADGPVQQAFSVRGWPAMCRLGHDGTVVTSDNAETVALPAAQ